MRWSGRSARGGSRPVPHGARGLRAAAALLALAALAPSPGRADDATGPGSVTVLSRPSGAWFTLRGGQRIAGRTPLTLSRGLMGRYHVAVGSAGYETWRSPIVLDGVRADTLWATLRPKHAWLAAARSMVVPGWGQFYGGRPGRGWVLLSAGLVATAGVVAAEVRARDRPDDAEARRWRAAARGAVGGVWGLGFLDAALSFKPPRPAPLAVIPVAGGSSAGWSAAARLRF